MTSGSPAPAGRSRLRDCCQRQRRQHDQRHSRQQTVQPQPARSWLRPPGAAQPLEHLREGGCRAGRRCTAGRRWLPAAAACAGSRCRRWSRRAPASAHPSPWPTSTVTSRWFCEIGRVAMWRITPPAEVAPSGVRLSSHSASGIITMIATNHSSGAKESWFMSELPAGPLPHCRLSRRMRSDGVTMSVRRMPNLSLTTTTSPCAIR